MTNTERAIDHVLGYLYDNAKLIATAHDELNVPLQDLFNGAVQRALELRASDIHSASLVKIRKADEQTNS